MDNKIICPACKKEISDVAAFRKTMTCPLCNAFLKNNKEVIKSLSAQSNKKNSVINSKNFMGINIPAQSDDASKNNEKKQTSRKQESTPKTENNKPAIKKEFNQNSRPAPKQQAPIPKEDLSLFEDTSSDYIPPELDALYDDDDYITVDNEVEEKTSIVVDDEYYDPEDEDDEEEVVGDIWDSEASDEDEDDIPVMAVLADLDDENDFSDADILGTPNVSIPDEDYLDDDSNDDEETSDETTVEEAEPVEQTEQISEEVVEESESEDLDAPGSDLDLFSDLNAVSTRAPKPKKKPTTTQPTMPEPVIENDAESDDDYYYPEDEEDEDDYEEVNEADEWSDDVDDLPEDDYDNEEPQMSIAAKFVKNITKSKKKHTLPGDDERVIDINDDIGRKVEKTVFNSNKDGYYSDAQPFIDPEPDIIPPRSILKVVGIFAGLIFFTAYFIYML